MTSLTTTIQQVWASDTVQPPPYQMAGASGVGISVVWDEAAIRKALPPNIQPVKGMTGGITIYKADKGYVIGPYSAAYLYVDVEGFNSPEGIKGRWMLAGVYGPQAKTSEALATYYGLPVRNGTSRQEATVDGTRAVGTVDGKDVVTAEVKPLPGSCKAAAISLNYLSKSPKSGDISVLQIPFVGDACGAEVISAKVTAPADDPFGKFSIAKVVGASALKNGAFTFTAPQTVAK